MYYQYKTTINYFTNKNDSALFTTVLTMVWLAVIGRNSNRACFALF